MDRRKLDVAMTSLLIITSLIILISDDLVQGGVETDLGSMFLPRIVAAVILIISATIGISSVQKLMKCAPIDGSEEFIATDGFLGVAIYVFTLVMYWLAVPYVGFLVATPFAMLSITILLGGRNWLSIIAMSVIMPLAVFYLCREFLQVFLPTGSLFGG